MEKEFLLLTATREAYCLDQIERTMTVGELIEFLEGYDKGMPVCLSHDHGYTYGAIRGGLFHRKTVDLEDE